MVLPGAQALLGFQLITIFMEGFDKLPNSSKFIHIGSLVLIALTMILLMSPAAYHRIAEQGDGMARPVVGWQSVEHRPATVTFHPG